MDTSDEAVEALAEWAAGYACNNPEHVSSRCAATLRALLAERATQAAAVAAARTDERARAADAAHNAIHDAIYEMCECERVKSAVLDALAAQPAVSGADALAAGLKRDDRG